MDASLALAAFLVVAVMEGLLPTAYSIPGLSLNRPVTDAEGSLPARTRADVCFRYNSLKRLRKQRSLGYWQQWFGNFRARPGSSFGYISQSMRAFGSSLTFIALPARGRDTGAFPKRS